MVRPFFEDILGIVFDFDGVILPDSEKVNIAAAVKTFADMNYHLSPEEIASIPGKSSGVFIPSLLRARDRGPKWDGQVIAVNRKNYDDIWPAGAKMAPGLVDVLIHLKNEGIALAIATSNRRSVIDRFLSSMLPIDLDNPFRLIVTGEQVKQHKPHPEVYEFAAAGLRIPPSKLLAVEDQGIGGAAANAAGLRWASVRNSFNQQQDFSSADYQLESLLELLAIKGGG